MKYTQRQPCSECPFRRCAPAGWVGDASPADFIDTAMADHAMPCHQTVDYEQDDWRDQLIEEGTKVQHCAGARIFFANQCKLPRNPVYLLAIERGQVIKLAADKERVFANRAEFLAHHEALLRRRR